MSKMPHIQLDSGICARAAILPGDPARVDAVAAFLQDVRQEEFCREYKSITGTYKGVRVLVISTGMGGASTAICAEELADLGVTDMIRIGSCGALQSHLSLGELVLCDRAVCDDGTSQSYTGYLRYADPALNPAVQKAGADIPLQNGSKTAERADAGSTFSPQSSSGAPKQKTVCAEPDNQIQYTYADPDLLHACESAAAALGFAHCMGATRCHDALYLRRKPELDEFYSSRGVYASDMETAALFAVGNLRGVRTASILNVVVEWKKDLKDGISSYKEGADASAQGERNEILTALEALVLMAKS